MMDAKLQTVCLESVCIYSKVHLSMLPENVKKATLLGPHAEYKIPECLITVQIWENFHFFILFNSVIPSNQFICCEM
jgi:hypothetical protein